MQRIIRDLNGGIMKKIIKPPLQINVSNNLIYCLDSCEYKRRFSCNIFGGISTDYKYDKVFRHKKCRELT